jgi:Flp pilus assembly pilin Flp
MSLALDKDSKLPAAKVFPAHAGDAHSGHGNRTERLCVLKSLLSPSGPILRLVYEEEGQDLVEYAFIMALVALGALATISGLAGKLKNALGVVGSNLVSAT